jgi:hypothetical protein
LRERLQACRHIGPVVRVHQVHEWLVGHFLHRPAEGLGQRRVGGDEAAGGERGDRHQVLRQAPHAVALGRMGRRLVREVFVRLAQFLFLLAQVGDRLHLAGGFEHGAEDAADRTGFVADRAVRERVPCLLRVAVALDHDRQILEEAALALEGAAGDGADRVPRFRPYVRKAPAERFFFAKQRHVSVVVEGDEVSTPAQEAGEF